jgi:hypothetical protein
MLSDTLFEAIEEIEMYEKNYPQVYGGIKDEIAEVKAVMRKLQRKLDTPPSFRQVEATKGGTAANAKKAKKSAAKKSRKK